MSVLIWQKCLDYLQDELPSQQFNTWIRPLVAEGDRDELKLHAPNRFVLDWVNEKFLSRIIEILEQVTGNNAPQVVLVVSRKKPPSFRKNANRKAPPSSRSNYRSQDEHAETSSSRNSPLPENPVIQELDFVPFDENDVPHQPAGGFPFSELNETAQHPQRSHKSKNPPSQTPNQQFKENFEFRDQSKDFTHQKIELSESEDVINDFAKSGQKAGFDFDKDAQFNSDVLREKQNHRRKDLVPEKPSNIRPSSFEETSRFNLKDDDELLFEKSNLSNPSSKPDVHNLHSNEDLIPDHQTSLSNNYSSSDQEFKSKTEIENHYDTDQYYGDGGHVKFSIGSHTSSLMDEADKQNRGIDSEGLLSSFSEQEPLLGDQRPIGQNGLGVEDLLTDPSSQPSSRLNPLSSTDLNSNSLGQSSSKLNKDNIKHQSYLNKSFTFDTFVEGKSNQLARAAAAQVAENAGSAYNPLFLYGGVGLGKTHLMHAVGNNIARKNPNAKVVYLHSERFVADMVKALQLNAINEFKRYYRSVDALLIDDIQFFAGKERSQEEFFHTFNALLEGNQQMILTCDRYPKEITGLEERLKSRFGWGLTVAVEPPELETRVAILMKKADQAKVDLPNEAAFFIAQKIRSNVRELEGALKRVIAQAHFTGNTITTPFIKESLKDLLALQDKQVSIENIQKTIAEYFKIKVSDLLSKRRSRSVARPRQIAMTLAKELTSHSLPEIGDAFGGRDHTTVLHACRKVKELREANADIREDYNNLMRLLTT